MWSSVGYGDDDKQAAVKTESAAASRRSPIRRRSPTSPGVRRDPESGEIRTFLAANSRRNAAPRRAIPPQAPVPQTVHRSYRPTVRSPLGPSLPDRFNDILSCTISSLEVVCAQADNLLQQYSRRPDQGSPTDEESEESAPALLDVLDFRNATRAQLNSLEQWESAFQRGDVDVSSIPAEETFRNELRCLSLDTQWALRELSGRLARIHMRHQDYSDPGPSRRPLSPTMTEIREAASELPPLRPMRPRSVYLRRRPVIAGAAGNASETVSFTSLARHGLTIDGLGDRTRSASPENDPDAWDTMRMTLEPDDRLPSADSSFTTAAASASFSGGSSSSGESSAVSANSSRTSLTTPSIDDGPCESDENAEGTSNFGGQDVASWRHTLPTDEGGSSSRTAHEERRRRSPDGPLRERNYVRRSRSGFLHYTRYAPPPQEDPTIDSFLRPVDGRFTYSFMPRSQSPLSFTAFNGSPSEPSIANVNDTNVESRPRPSFLFNPPTPPPQLNRLSELDSQRPDRAPISTSTNQEGSRSVVQETVRLALRYASRVATSSDPHADPELEHMRSLLQEMANNGEISDELWIGAGLASLLQD